MTPPPPRPTDALDGRGRILAVLGVVIAVLALVTAAVVFLGGDDDSVATGASTTSTTAATSSTTSTTEATTTTTTTEADADPLPVIVADGYVLGYWDGTDWQSATNDEANSFADLPPSPVSTGTPYEFIDLLGAAFRTTLGTVGEGCYLGTSWGVFDEVTENRVGLPIGFEPLPRPVVPIAAAPQHEDAVRAWLQSEGQEDPVVSIDHVIRVDIDGNGTDEVFIAASDRADGGFHSEPGAYSVLLYRYVDAAEEVQTVVIAGDVVTQEEIDSEFGLAFTHQILAIIDLNEDGRLELVTESGFYEGHAVSVQTIVGPRIDVVLSTGCGA